MPATVPCSSSVPHIGILMAVYNGAETLPEQLDSLAAQSHANWQLLVSDDGSDDDSCAVLERFGLEQSLKLSVLQGPQQGAGQNFMFLLTQAAQHLPEGSWLAFCDQDDVWLPERLSLGVAALEALPEPDGPALFCSRTWVVDHDLGNRRLSSARPHPPGFRNALVQNIAAGNTILLNAAGAALLMAAAAEAGEVVMHDWWAYQMITGAGGVVVHDDTPVLLYRQHAGNEVGANSGLRAKLHRLQRMVRGDFRAWNDTNIAALQACRDRLTPEAQAQLDAFEQLRKQPLWGRLRELRRLGLYRQSRAAMLSLTLAACLGRL